MNATTANLFANLFETTMNEVIEKYLLTQLTAMEGRIRQGFEKELLNKLEDYFARYEGRLEALEDVVNDKTLVVKPVVNSAINEHYSGFYKRLEELEERVAEVKPPASDRIRAIVAEELEEALEMDYDQILLDHFSIDDYESEIKDWVDEKMSEFDLASSPDFTAAVRSVVRDMTFSAD